MSQKLGYDDIPGITIPESRGRRVLQAIQFEGNRARNPDRRENFLKSIQVAVILDAEIIGQGLGSKRNYLGQALKSIPSAIYDIARECQPPGMRQPELPLSCTLVFGSFDSCLKGLVVLLFGLSHLLVSQKRCEALCS